MRWRWRWRGRGRGRLTDVDVPLRVWCMCMAYVLTTARGGFKFAIWMGMSNTGVCMCIHASGRPQGEFFFVGSFVRSLPTHRMNASRSLRDHTGVQVCGVHVVCARSGSGEDELCRVDWWATRCVLRIFAIGWLMFLVVIWAGGVCVTFTLVDVVCRVWHSGVLASQCTKAFVRLFVRSFVRSLLFAFFFCSFFCFRAFLSSDGRSFHIRIQ